MFQNRKNKATSIYLEYKSYLVLFPFFKILLFHVICQQTILFSLFNRFSTLFTRHQEGQEEARQEIGVTDESRICDEFMIAHDGQKCCYVNQQLVVFIVLIVLLQ